MIEFTFMGRRYALLACRLNEAGELTDRRVLATPGDLEAAGYQAFTRPRPEAPAKHVISEEEFAGWQKAVKTPVCAECGYTVSAHANDCSKRDPMVVWVPDTLRLIAKQRESEAQGTPVKPFNPNCPRCVDSPGGICAFHENR